jgi:hypothetical protein
MHKGDVLLKNTTTAINFTPFLGVVKSHTESVNRVSTSCLEAERPCITVGAFTI